MDTRHPGFLLAASVVVISAISGCIIYLVFSRTPERQPLEHGPGWKAAAEAPQSRKSAVNLYFANEKAGWLSAENRVLDHPGTQSEFGGVIIDALIEGPRTRLGRTIPGSALRRAMYVTKEGIAYVDLSRETAEDHPGGVESELITIYSIVNSLVLNIPEIKAVKILIDGKESETLTGHVDLRFPFVADIMMIR